MTQTMRERLIAKLMEEIGAGDPDETGAYRPLEGEYKRVDFGDMIDAILAELREPDEAMRQIGRDYDGIGNEPALAGFTAMIDAVREGK